MAKQDVVAAQLALIQSAQLQAITDGLGAAYDADRDVTGVPSDDQIKAAVDAAVAPLKAQIDADAQALADAQGKAASDLAAVNIALADMTTKEQLEEGAVAGLQSSIAQMQSSLDAIKAIALPVPAPTPVPAV